MRSALPAHVTVATATDPVAVRPLLAPDADVIDVLIVDGDLQPRGGYAFLYDIREQGGLGAAQSPPALVLTERDQDRWLARWAGANATETKPTDPFTVARTVLMLNGAAPAEHGDKNATAAQLALAQDLSDV